MEKNRSLSNNDKIQVLSISAGCKPESKRYKEFIEAIEENIFIVTLNMFNTYEDKFYFYGLDVKTAQKLFSEYDCKIEVTNLRLITEGLSTSNYIVDTKNIQLEY